MKIRLIIISIFSFVKRLFFVFPDLYGIIIYLPLLTVFNTKNSKKSLFFVLFFVLIIVATGKLLFIVDFIPLILLLIFKPSFESYKFDATLSKLTPLYIILSLYGIYQFIFGFNSFELGWINSNLGTVGTENFNTDKTIRPFSTFAGIPEFTFFCALFSYHFYTEKKNTLFLISIVILILSGSRGVIVSTIVAFTIIYFLKNNSYIKMLFKGFLLSILIFVSLIFVYPFFFQFS